MRSIILGLFLAAAPAHAGDLAAVEQGWYLNQIGDEAAAAELAAGLLRDDPRSGAAHRLFITTTFRWDDSDRIVREYRAWLAESPDDPLRRTALAHALATASSTDAVCEEADALLGIPPEDPADAYQNLRVRVDLAEDCGWDQAAIEGALLALAPREISAKPWALRTLFSRGDGSADTMSMYSDLVRKQPRAVGEASKLWDSESESREVRRARKTAVSSALKLSRSDDPAVVHAAWSVLKAASHPKASAVKSRWDEVRGREVSVRDPVEVLVAQAGHQPTFEGRLRALEAVEARVPASGKLRAHYLRGVADLQAALGREEAAMDARLQAWRAAPDEPSVANDFAWSSAETGVHTELALEAIEGALAALRAQEAPADGQVWAAWTSRRNSNLRNYLDTKAWLLFQSGRFEEASVAQQEAIDRGGVGAFELRMALILHAMGLADDARELLVEVYKDADGVPEQEQVDEVLRELMASDPMAWMPATTLMTAMELPGVPTSESVEGEASGGPEQYALLGQPFPIQRFRVDGKERTLDEWEGPLVIDLWATWCGPCIAAMPHLDELAGRYREQGLQVLGISVDEREAELAKFFGRKPDVAWTIGWYGRSGFADAEVRGIPAQFVLDAEHRVVGMVMGWAPGDERLEELIREALEL